MDKKPMNKKTKEELVAERLGIKLLVHENKELAAKMREEAGRTYEFIKQKTFDLDFIGQEIGEVCSGCCVTWAEGFIPDPSDATQLVPNPKAKFPGKIVIRNSAVITENQIFHIDRVLEEHDHTKDDHTGPVAETRSKVADLKELVNNSDDWKAADIKKVVIILAKDYLRQLGVEDV